MIRIQIYLIHLYLYFFFQAEDGIRDGHVTGVQTCALPISRSADQTEEPRPTSRELAISMASSTVEYLIIGRAGPNCSSATSGLSLSISATKIGRASCRERV